MEDILWTSVLLKNFIATAFVTNMKFEDFVPGKGLDDEHMFEAARIFARLSKAVRDRTYAEYEDRSFGATDAGSKM